MAPLERLLIKDRDQPRFNMIHCQLRPNGVKDERVIQAFESVSMEDFVLPAVQSMAYADAHLPLTPELPSQRWLLSPLILGNLLQLADIQPLDKVLIIGCGAGYSLALAVQLAAQVVGVESNEKLAEMALSHFPDQEISRVRVILGALSIGYPKESPYDVILMEGAVDRIPPLLMQQLNPAHGRLVAVIKEQSAVGQIEFGAGTLIVRTGDAVSQVVKFDASCPYLPEFEPRLEFRL